MCVCTITAQQLELDLAHTLKTPSVATPSNDLFLPTEENFKAAVDQTLNDSAWFREWAEGIITANVDNSVSEMVEEDVRHYFNHNFNVADHVDIDESIERVIENYDFDDTIDCRVDEWLSNNLDVDDAVSDAVRDYFDDNVDVDEVAKQNIAEILKDMDFIEALAAEMLRQQQQAKHQQQTQGETNESM